MEQMQFQQQLYKDKRDMEIIGLLLTVLEKVGFRDEKANDHLEKILYDKTIEYVTPKVDSNTKLLI